MFMAVSFEAMGEARLPGYGKGTTRTSARARYSLEFLLNA